MKCKVQFFKPSGKYYTEEEIELPADAMPWRLEPFLPKDRLKDMLVYFSGDAPWGFPVLLRVGALTEAAREEALEEAAKVAAEYADRHDSEHVSSEAGAEIAAAIRARGGKTNG